jgi:hypothetical protein
MTCDLCHTSIRVSRRIVWDGTRGVKKADVLLAFALCKVATGAISFEPGRNQVQGQGFGCWPDRGSGGSRLGPEARGSGPPRYAERHITGEGAGMAGGKSPKPDQRRVRAGKRACSRRTSSVGAGTRIQSILGRTSSPPDDDIPGTSFIPPLAITLCGGGASVEACGVAVCAGSGVGCPRSVANTRCVRIFVPL